MIARSVCARVTRLRGDKMNSTIRFCAEGGGGDGSAKKLVLLVIFRFCDINVAIIDHIYDVVTIQ